MSRIHTKEPSNDSKPTEPPPKPATLKPKRNEVSFYQARDADKIRQALKRAYERILDMIRIATEKQIATRKHNPDISIFAMEAVDYKDLLDRLNQQHPEGK